MRSFRRKRPQPFETIAPFYDRIMQDVDYEGWVNYVESFFHWARGEVHEVLDLACGTGTPTLLLKQRGYRVVGLDRSVAMLREARKKLGPDVPLVAADLRHFAFRKQFDAVISLFDSLNNLLTELELTQTFENVRRHLREGGVFVFDVNTIYALENYWGNDTKVKEHGGLITLWRTSYLPHNHLSRLDFTVLVPEGNESTCYRRYDETHLERGYPLKTLKTLLNRSGFRRVYQFRHLTRHTASERDLRVTVVAR